MVIATGLLLQLKKQVPWVQPPTQKSTAAVPTLSFEAILAAARTAPTAQLRAWADIDRLDVRLDKGIIKVLGKNKWEVQLDYHTGAVLQTAFRRSDFIESLHDGSYFGDPIKLGIYLPAALLLFILWLSGLYLFFQPYFIRLSRRRLEKQKLRTVAS